MSIQVKHFWSIVRQGLNNKDSLLIMWSGGRSVKNFFKKKEYLDGIDFSKIDFVLSDERIVDPSSSDSNAGGLERNLAESGIKARSILFYCDTYFDDLMSMIYNNGGKIDIALLGMGSDGHCLGQFEFFNDSWMIFKRADEEYHRYTHSVSFINEYVELVCLICNTESKLLALINPESVVSRLKTNILYDKV